MPWRSCGVAGDAVALTHDPLSERHRRAARPLDLENGNATMRKKKRGPLCTTSQNEEKRRNRRNGDGRKQENGMSRTVCRDKIESRGLVQVRLVVTQERLKLLLKREKGFAMIVLRHGGRLGSISRFGSTTAAAGAHTDARAGLQLVQLVEVYLGQPSGDESHLCDLLRTAR